MRVLSTADTVGGVWTYAIDLAAALATASAGGVQTTLVTMGRPLSPDQWRDARAVPGLRIVETSYKLEWMSDPWADVDAAGALLLDLAIETQPDVVHLNGFAHASLSWDVVRAPVVVVGHSCVETWWRAVKREGAGVEWHEYRERVHRGIHDADAFVAPTRAMLDAFALAHGRHAHPHLVANGRDPSLFRPLAKEPFVLAAGRVWDEAKNIAALDDAARDIAWPVLVAGEDHEPGGGGSRGCANAQPLGRLSPTRLAEVMGHASVYALPAKYEPFGLSAVEAALCGCALVLGDIPTLREVWGDDAIYVSPHHPLRLADAVNTLIGDAPRRRDFAERGRRRAQRYTAQRMAGDYLALYRGLIRQTARRAPAPADARVLALRS